MEEWAYVYESMLGNLCNKTRKGFCLKSRNYFSTHKSSYTCFVDVFFDVLTIWRLLMEALSFVDITHLINMLLWFNQMRELSRMSNNALLRLISRAGVLSVAIYKFNILVYGHIVVFSTTKIYKPVPHETLRLIRW